MNMPYAHCKGILMGTLTMELGGKVTVECEKTGYRTELEFKLRVSVCLCGQRCVYIDLTLISRK